jgi:plastocyanin
MAVQSNFYFPNNLTIDAGDSITWSLKSGEFHSVTFLSGGAPPPLIIAGPQLNPLALFPQGGNSYNGSGYVNSGLMSVGPIPKTFTLTFTKPGDYQYNCLVHSPMKGWVHVQPAGAAYPHNQSFYNSQAQALEAQTIGQGYGLMALGFAKAVSAGLGHVTVGIGQFFDTGSLMIVRFLPKLEIVHVGQTVTWTNLDPEAPHTVTFNLPGLDTNPFSAFAPSSNVSGGSATLSSPSDGVNSGVLVAGGPTQFRVKFAAPGTYQYRCALHDDLGMTGTVVVLPN